MSAKPTTDKGRRTREHLVNSGRAVFARVGYVDARMSDVATEADISMGGLYRYFKNKEDLFAQVISDLHENFDLPDRSPHFEMLRSILKSYRAE